VDTIVSLKQAIEQIVKEKGIDRQVVIEAMEQAVLSAANKKYRNTRNLEAHYNNDTGEVELFEYVVVVEEVQDSYTEISLDEAREMDPECEVGDELGEKIDSGDFGRIAAQTAKQVIIQKVREAERETVFNVQDVWEIVTVRSALSVGSLIDLAAKYTVTRQMPAKCSPGDHGAIITTSP